MVSVECDQFDVIGRLVLNQRDRLGHWVLKGLA
jgi:hypothetical protein